MLEPFQFCKPKSKAHIKTFWRAWYGMVLGSSDDDLEKKHRLSSTVFRRLHDINFESYWITVKHGEERSPYMNKHLFCVSSLSMFDSQLNHWSGNTTAIFGVFVCCHFFCQNGIYSSVIIPDPAIMAHSIRCQGCDSSIRYSFVWEIATKLIRLKHLLDSLNHVHMLQVSQ